MVKKHNVIYGRPHNGTDRERACEKVHVTIPDWKKSMHYAGRLVDSDAPKFSASNFVPKF